MATAGTDIAAKTSPNHRSGPGPGGAPIRRPPVGRRRGGPIPSVDGALLATQPPWLPPPGRISLAAIVLNVATGAAVRLSDSGLGCPDWPTCSQRQLTPPSSLHPVIEFGNRMVVLILVVACAADLRGLVPPPAGPPGPAVAVRRARPRRPGRGRARGGRRLLQAQRLRGHDPLHGGHRPPDRVRRAVPPGRPRPGPGHAGRDAAGAAADPGLPGPADRGRGRRHRHHRGRAPRRRQGGQAGRHRPVRHDPDPRRGGVGDRHRPAGHPVRAVEVRRPGPHPGVGADPARASWSSRG